MNVDREVLCVLDSAEIVGRTLRLTGSLDRRLYLKTDTVLQAAGGKWNRKSKAHVFDDDAQTAIEQILLTGQVAVPQDFGYFPTPDAVVDELMVYANLSPGMRMLEPSAGQGAIALRAAAVIGQRNVRCVELLEKNVDILKAAGFVVTRGDFLSCSPEEIAFRPFDRIVMNPPFSRQQDIVHVNHALQFLKPAGILISVMSSGVTFRGNRLSVAFRTMIKKRNGVILFLPEKSFREAGTMVNAVVAIVPGVPEE